MAMDDDGAPLRCSTVAPAHNNLVFSPLSICAALSLAAAGAKGRTLSELLHVLGAKSRESLAENVRCMVERALPAKPEPGGGGPRVEHACGLWHDAARSLKPACRDVAAASCRAVARAVDFLNKPEAAREEINNWGFKVLKVSSSDTTWMPIGREQQASLYVVTFDVYMQP